MFQIRQLIEKVILSVQMIMNSAGSESINKSNATNQLCNDVNASLKLKQTLEDQEEVVQLRLKKAQLEHRLNCLEYKRKQLELERLLAEEKKRRSEIENRYQDLKMKHLMLCHAKFEEMYHELVGSNNDKKVSSSTEAEINEKLELKKFELKEIYKRQTEVEELLHQSRNKVAYLQAALKGAMEDFACNSICNQQISLPHTPITSEEELDHLSSSNNVKNVNKTSKMNTASSIQSIKKCLMQELKQKFKSTQLEEAIDSFNNNSIQNK